MRLLVLTGPDRKDDSENHSARLCADLSSSSERTVEAGAAFISKLVPESSQRLLCVGTKCV